MTHLRVSEITVLAAVVAGTMAFGFALVDYQVFERSTFETMLLGTAVVMGLSTVYHVALILDRNAAPTNPVFGASVETIIALTGLTLLVLRLRNGGVDHH
ncbi:MAG: hypothetical protein ABEJ89_06045 [Haloarculaceae archaeon]